MSAEQTGGPGLLQALASEVTRGRMEGSFYPEHHEHSDSEYGDGYDAGPPPPAKAAAADES